MVSRDEIVAALASVPGLTAKRTLTGPVSPGDAWPVWQGTRWANVVPDGVRLASWEVLVALPDQGSDVTVSEADPLVETVGMALVDAGLQIESVGPSRTNVTETSSGVPVLRYLVHD
jgi:hypothetical protein